VMVAPPGTPLAIRQQINETVAKALASAEVEQALTRLGAQARPAPPEEATAFLVREQQRWSRLIEAARISID